MQVGPDHSSTDQGGQQAPTGSIMQYLGGSNEQALRNGVTLLMCGAAAHAVYLAAAPEPLRVPVAIRNAALWKRLSIGALAVVAVYDGWQSRRLAVESATLTDKIRKLNMQLLQDN